MDKHLLSRTAALNTTLRVLSKRRQEVGTGCGTRPDAAQEHCQVYEALQFALILDIIDTVLNCFRPVYLAACDFLFERCDVK